jgi:hypothetical protein
MAIRSVHKDPVNAKGDTKARTILGSDDQTASQRRGKMTGTVVFLLGLATQVLIYPPLQDAIEILPHVLLIPALLVAI